MKNIAQTIKIILLVILCFRGQLKGQSTTPLESLKNWVYYTYNYNFNEAQKYLTSNTKKLYITYTEKYMLTEVYNLTLNERGKIKQDEINRRFSLDRAKVTTVENNASIKIRNTSFQFQRFNNSWLLVGNNETFEKIINTKDYYVEKRAAVDKEWANLIRQSDRRINNLKNLQQTIKDSITKQKFEKCYSDYFQLNLELNRINLDKFIDFNNKLMECISNHLIQYKSDYYNSNEETILKLMDEIAGSENRLAVAKEIYNEAVKESGLDLLIKADPNKELEAPVPKF